MPFSASSEARLYLRDKSKSMQIPLLHCGMTNKRTGDSKDRSRSLPDDQQEDRQRQVQEQRQRRNTGVSPLRYRFGRDDGIFWKGGPLQRQRQKAGPSTPPLAKSASGFALDDTFGVDGRRQSMAKTAGRCFTFPPIAMKLRWMGHPIVCGGCRRTGNAI